MRGFIPPTSDEERLFCRRVEDAVNFVRSRGILRVLPFCSDREQSLAESVFARERFSQYAFFGGYAEAERKMLALAEDEIAQTDLPLCAVFISHAAQSAAPGHRDYLGALLSLRIGRELLGDIVLVPNGAVVFAHERAADVVENELVEVGRVSVHTQAADKDMLDALDSAQDRPVQTGTLPSLRLDAMLATMLKTSRGAAAEMIRAKAVMINHIETTSCHSEIDEGDIFTVRGKGKYKLCSIGGQSKKNRIFVSWIQY